MNAFQQSRGTVSRRTSNVVNSKETLGTLSKFADRNVARKTTKPPSLRRYVDPGSISQLRPKPAAQDRGEKPVPSYFVNLHLGHHSSERRNTLPAKPTEEIDLTMDDDDDVAPSAIHKRESTIQSPGLLIGESTKKPGPSQRQLHHCGLRANSMKLWGKKMTQLF